MAASLISVRISGRKLLCSIHAPVQSPARLRCHARRRSEARLPVPPTPALRALSRRAPRGLFTRIPSVVVSVLSGPSSRSVNFFLFISLSLSLPTYLPIIHLSSVCLSIYLSIYHHLSLHVIQGFLHHLQLTFPFTAISVTKGRISSSW